MMKEGIQVTRLGQVLESVSLHPLLLMVDIVLRTMTILTALKYYFDFSNVIFQKGAEAICESTCVSAVWKR